MKPRWSFGRRRKPSLMDRLEEWLPEEVRERIPPAVEQALRKRLDKIDLEKLEALLGERLGQVDRAKVEMMLRTGLDALNSRRANAHDAVEAARSRVPDRASLETAIRDRIEAILPERLDQLLRERVESVKPHLPKPVAPTKPVTPRKPQAAPAPASSGVNPVAALVGGSGRLAFFVVAGWIAYNANSGFMWVVEQDSHA